MIPDRQRALSVLFGMVSAGVVAVVGPLYGGLVLILGFPLVFRTASRVAAGWLVVAFASSWLLVLALGAAPITRNAPIDNSAGWLAIGLIPVILVGVAKAVARLQAASRTL